MGGGDSAFTYKILVFSMVIVLMLPVMLNIYAPNAAIDVDKEELFDGYERFTGQQASTKESIWVLTGIYTPYDGDSQYGYTEDGWLYSSRISSYTPSQIASTPSDYTVYRDTDGVYRYYTDSSDYNENTGTGHRGTFVWDADSGQYVKRDQLGELYTSVQFDREQQSSMFFTDNMKVIDEDNKHFYFDYTGYRYAFQPIADYHTKDADGEIIPVVATTTSLSLIWYSYYTYNGIAGQLILSGSDSGVAYLTSENILSAFNSTTSTARFNMTFNGVDMNVYIKIDPFYLSNGYTVKQCYDMGYWSVMVTSLSTDSDAYTGTDYSLNPANILQTVIDIMTFNYADYGIPAIWGALCTILFCLPLYAGLLTLCLDHAYLWVIMGILAAIQSLSVFNLL